MRLTDSSLVHARNTQHDRVFERQRATRERGTRPARHDLDVVLVAVAEDGAHLLGIGRQDHRQRQAAIGGERVGLEGAAPLLVGDQACARSNLLQLLQDLVPALQDREIRAGQGDMRHQRLRARPKQCFKENRSPSLEKQDMSEGSGGERHAHDLAAVRSANRAGVNDPEWTTEQTRWRRSIGRCCKRPARRPPRCAEVRWQEQSPEAEADEDVAPAEVRRERRPEPHESDVHQRVERQGNRAVRIRRKAEVLANHVRE